jgi:hypothetical protein
MNAVRSAPVLTQVPVTSLKFSAVRPSKTKPSAMSCGSAKRSASPKRQ